MRLYFTKMHGTVMILLLSTLSPRVAHCAPVISASWRTDIAAWAVTRFWSWSHLRALLWTFAIASITRMAREVEQCGNGARCFARFVREKKLTGKRVISVETASGIIELRVLANHEVEVQMAVPEFEPGNIPFDAPARAAQLCVANSRPLAWR